MVSKSTKALADVIVDSIQNKKGKNITKLDLTKLDQSVADYFIICHGGSNTQVDAIAREVQNNPKEVLQERPLHVEGLNNSTWVLVDYGDVVVHIFQEEYRRFYDLEGLWADADQEVIEDIY